MTSRDTLLIPDEIPDRNSNITDAACISCNDKLAVAGRYCVDCAPERERLIEAGFPQ